MQVHIITAVQVTMRKGKRRGEQCRGRTVVHKWSPGVSGVLNHLFVGSGWRFAVQTGINLPQGPGVSDAGVYTKSGNLVPGCNTCTAEDPALATYPALLRTCASNLISTAVARGAYS